MRHLHHHHALIKGMSKGQAPETLRELHLIQRLVEVEVETEGQALQTAGNITSSMVSLKFSPKVKL